MKSLQSYRDDFGRNGYVIARGFLSSVEIDALKENLRRYVENVVPTLPETEAFFEISGKPVSVKQLQAMERHDAYFAEFNQRHAFSDLAESLLGMPVVPQGVQYFSKPPRLGKPTPPHQDGYYFCLNPSEAITLWFPLDEANEENGCIRYVAGSHKRGLRPHGLSGVLGFSQTILDWSRDDEMRESKAIAKPGDLLVHHCDTIHRADANLSSRPRRALSIVYFAAAAIRDEEAWVRYQTALARQRAAL
jgi:phytanoyl-CoA hydroxylase